MLLLRLTKVLKPPFINSNVVYADMAFVYRFCNCNSAAAVEEYRRRFWHRRVPSCRVSACAIVVSFPKSV